MNEDCCLLGKQINDKRKVLYRGDNFTVTPAFGQISIEGYLLICSNNHYVGIGGMPSELDGELEDVLSKTKEVVSANYSENILVFEHGPKFGHFSGGGCLDHSHLHVVPTRTDVLSFLKGRDFEMEIVEGFDRHRNVYHKKESSYLFVETQDGERYFSEFEFNLPSQYIRQVVCFAEGRENWDWTIDPERDRTFEATMETLEGKF